MNHRLSCRSSYFRRSVSFFFFQAEDGIRDLTVTGVQTCALPIYQLQPVSRCTRHDYLDRQRGSLSLVSGIEGCTAAPHGAGQGLNEDEVAGAATPCVRHMRTMTPATDSLGRP